MTREEAILVLHDMKDTYDEIHENTNYEIGYEQMTALDMAIDALEREAIKMLKEKKADITSARKAVIRYAVNRRGRSHTEPSNQPRDLLRMSRARVDG